MKKTPWIIAGVAIILGAIVGFFLWHNSSHPSLVAGNASSTTMNTISTGDTLSSSLAESGCLPSDETASYFVTSNQTSSDVGTVIVTNNVAATKISEFTIPDVYSQEYHDYEIHDCALYIIRRFNYDYIHGEALPNFNMQLLKYIYSGTGIEIGSAEDFRVNPQESLIAIVPFGANFPGSSIQIYDLAKGKTEYSLSLSQIPAESSNTIMDFDLGNGGWDEAGRYIWIDSTNAADLSGFIRIDTLNWSYQIFSAPQVTMGGDAFNPDTGMTTYRTNAAPWTADSQIDQQYQQAAAQSGQISSFNIENLLTGQTYVVATTTDPTYYYRPQWLSDSVLEYTLPSGVTSTYTVR